MALNSHLVILRDALRDGSELTNADVQARLGVSERQARRILGDLNAAGPPVEIRRDGRGKLYSFAPEHRSLLSAPVPLTEAEALALSFAAGLARPALTPTPLVDGLRTAVEKLIPSGDVVTFEPEEASAQFVVGGAIAAHIDPVTFNTVRRAVAERRSLSFRYTNVKGEASTRTVDPYAIAIVQGSWLLLANDPASDMVLHFALPTVEDTHIGDPYGDRAEDFDAQQHLRDAFGAFAGGRVETIRLLVGPTAAASFRRKMYHPTQLVEDEHGDGSLTVSFEAPVAPDLVAFVRSFGPAIRVLNPQTLQETVAADAEATVHLYAH